MNVSSDRVPSGSYFTPRIAALTPSISWNRVAEFFSHLNCCRRSDTLRGRIAPTLEELRSTNENLYPLGVIEKTIAYGNLKYLKNGEGKTYLKFSQSKKTPQLFENEEEFAKYLKDREDVEIWKIFDIRSKKWMLKYWDDFEETLVDYSSEKPLFYAICKDGDGAFKLIDIKKKKSKYIVDCSGYCSLDNREFNEERDFLEFINKRIDEGASTYKFLVVLAIFGVISYLRSESDAKKSLSRSKYMNMTQPNEIEAFLDEFADEL